MDLKEYIKSLIRELIEEDNVTSGGEAYSTPFAFSKKGQKSNGAIDVAKKEKMKLAPKIKEEVSHTDLKKGERFHYKGTINGKPLTGELEYVESTDTVEDPLYWFKWISRSDNKDMTTKFKTSKEGLKQYISPIGGEQPKPEEPMNETLMKIIQQELLNEVTYSRFKNEVKFRTKNEQLHKAIREVKRKLMEIDRIVEYTSRMKQELSEGEEGIKYWKATENNVARISEMVNHLNNKIKNLHQ